MVQIDVLNNMLRARVVTDLNIGPWTSVGSCDRIDNVQVYQHETFVRFKDGEDTIKKCLQVNGNSITVLDDLRA